MVPWGDKEVTASVNKVGKTGTRMSRGKMTSVSKCLDSPNCFAKKPRAQEDFDHWKATEFSHFAFYIGKIMLKGVLKADLFEHFMAFSTARCILVSLQLVKMDSAYAHDFLRYFIEQGGILCGQRFLVYSLHSLLHLADYVNNSRSLQCLPV